MEPIDQTQAEPEQVDLPITHDLLTGVRQDSTRQFVGIVAHSLNNLLTSIIGYAKHVQNNPPETQADMKLYAQDILAAADRASKLARDLLAFSRRATGARIVDLNDIVRNVKALLVNMLESNIEFLMQLSRSPLPVRADPAALEQVLTSLITNAQEAMPKGGCLTVRTGLSPENQCVLSVSDTGMGIEPDVIDRIFEPSFTTKAAPRGTGLSLAVVANVVKKHKGRLAVNSTLGKGTTFEVILPLAPIEAYKEKQAETAPVVGGKETILVAEDESAVRNLISLVLRELGYTVIEAIDGEDAIRQFTNYRDVIDLAILDVVMPTKNGNEVYQDLIQAKPELKALFMSGYTKDLVLGKGRIEELTDFIAKPLVPNKLLRKVRQILDRSV